MGNLTAYALGSALCLALCWLAYRLFLGGKKQPGFNRGVIISIYLLSLIWLPAAGLVERSWPRTYSGSPIQIGIDTVLVGLETVGEGAGAPWWATALVSLYTLGLMAASLWMAVSLIGIWKSLRHCRKVEGEGFGLLVSPRAGISPFSWGRCVVLSEDDYARMDSMVLAHELAHLRHRHWIDLLLGQAFCVFQWFNPAAWLLRSELRMIHEYEADGDVLAEGGEAREYQLLLLSRISNAALLNPLVNNFRTSNLKKRIAMMKKKESGLKARFGALALLPALAVAWMFNGSETFASVSDATTRADLPVSASAARSAIFLDAPATMTDSDAPATVGNAALADEPAPAEEASSEGKETKEIDGEKVYMTPD